MSPWVTWPAITKKLGTLGVLVSLLILAVEREELFNNNLFDVAGEGYYDSDLDCTGLEAMRTIDGTCNILENPMEGSIHTAFGRNVDPESSIAELDSGLESVPNPREVSNLLMARDEFKPATTLNFIAAAWIQFMTHDWFEHGVMKDGEASTIKIPAPANDPTLAEGEIIEIDRTLFEGVVVDSYQDFDEETGEQRTVQISKDLPVYRNQVTHWWDGSQIYGVTKERNDEIREFKDGRLKLDADGFIPTRFSGV